MRNILVRVIEGAAAGLAATVAMSAVLAVARKAGHLGEPPPRLLTRRIAKAFGVRLARRGVPLNALSLAGHAAYGAGMGALYGAIAGRRPSILGGASFGSAVWGLSYAGWVPMLGLMPPPKTDRPGRPTSMLLGHLMYGATLALALRKSLERSGRLESKESEATI